MKRLDGWEPALVPVYDADGRMLRLDREVEWDDDERTLMLAFTLYEEQLCPAGHWLPDSAAKEAEGQYRGRNSLCHACVAVADEVGRLKEHPRPGALMFGAERRG